MLSAVEENVVVEVILNISCVMYFFPCWCFPIVAGPKRNSAASIFSHNSRSKTRPLSLSPDTKAPLQSNGRRNSPMARTTNDRNNATDSAPPTVNDKAVTTSYHVTTERLLGPTKSLVLKVAGQAEILKQ